MCDCYIASIAKVEIVCLSGELTTELPFVRYKAQSSSFYEVMFSNCHWQVYHSKHLLRSVVNNIEVNFRSTTFVVR